LSWRAAPPFDASDPTLWLKQRTCGVKRGPAGQPASWLGARVRTRGGLAPSACRAGGGNTSTAIIYNITLFRGSIIKLTQQQQVISRNLTRIDQFLYIDLKLKIHFYKPT
jgi:hypothetical protein